MLCCKAAISFFLSMFSVTAVAAAHGPLALGVVLGDPTGLNMRYRVSSANSVDASLGWGRWDGIHAEGAYVWRFSNAFNASESDFEWYVGLGGALKTWDDSHCHGRWCDEDDSGSALSVRVPIGLSYLFSPAPIEVFGQLSPALTLVPGTGFDVDVGLGVRFYF